MNNDIRIEKTVYSKDDYNRVVDREFRTFINTVPEEEENTVEELFSLYESLFYEIPKEGEINSHKYIIRRSSEIVDFEKNSADIEPLLQEITQLRRELLNSNRQIIELENRLASQE